MSINITGLNNTFYFGSIDFSLGVTVNHINVIVSGSNVDLLANTPTKPILYNSQDFYNLLVVANISTGFVKSDIGTFIGNCDTLFQTGIAFQITFQGHTYNIDNFGSAPAKTS